MDPLADILARPIQPRRTSRCVPCNDQQQDLLPAPWHHCCTSLLGDTDYTIYTKLVKQSNARKQNPPKKQAYISKKQWKQSVTPKYKSISELERTRNNIEERIYRLYRELNSIRRKQETASTIEKIRDFALTNARYRHGPR
jgi:glycosidase